LAQFAIKGTDLKILRFVGDRRCNWVSSLNSVLSCPKKLSHESKSKGAVNRALFYLDADDTRTCIECLFGDAASRTLGFTPRGLSPWAGLALHDARLVVTVARR
jgi:hypothetical protein